MVYKEQFSPRMLKHLQETVEREPQILVKPEIKTVGVSSRYSEDDLDLQVLWGSFREVVSKIRNRKGENAFGIYEEYMEQDGKVGFSYICSVGGSNLEGTPDGMVTRIIPEHLYAVFKHKGDISTLPETLKYIWGSWLPKSGYDYEETPD